MTAPESVPRRKPSAPRKSRSPVERIIVWGGIVALLVVVGLEAHARVFHGRAVQQLQEQVRTADEGDSLLLADAERNVGGFHSRTDLRSSGKSRIVYRWPSLFRTYAVELKLTDEGLVESLETDPLAIESAPEQPLVAATRPEPPRIFPDRGLTRGSPELLALSRHDMTTPPRSHIQQPNSLPDAVVLGGPLTREILRQSFLIAAEENCQVSTRDETLGAEIDQPGQTGDFPWHLDIRVEDTGIVRMELQKASATQRRSTASIDLQVLDPARVMESLLEQSEQLSRSKFPETLSTSGYTLNPTKFLPEGPITTEIAEHLERLNEISQLAAVRALHGQIRREGASAARLAALSQAYSNLGSLTESHWQTHHKAFKARGLLYAQRLIALTDSSPGALAQRAYAWTLTGRPSAALADLQKISMANSGQLPNWVPALRACNDFDVEGIREQAGNAESLGEYLELLIANPRTDKSPHPVSRTGSSTTTLQTVVRWTSSRGSARSASLASLQRFRSTKSGPRFIGS